MRNIAIDFESYYDNELSIKTLGQWHYLRDPRGEIYMVSMVGDGIEPYCGPVDKAPWDKIDGCRWIAHNYSFDGACVGQQCGGGQPRRTDAGGLVPWRGGF